MNEILFKGRRFDNNQWIKGSLIVLDGANGYYFITEPYTSASTLPIRDLIYNHTHLVAPETVCQFTGLRDKNGNKIFEGDIVRCYSVTVSGMEEEEFVSDVFWLDCMWMLHAGEHCDGMLCYYDMTCEWGSHVPEIEVIGNIFDNPELLER